MRHFLPTWLYVKTHNVTGLKYFGKTTNDPYHYNGSGKYWKAHCKIHGYDITTQIIGFYEDRAICVNDALQFSKNNDIVNSPTWANMIVENGVDGGHIDRIYNTMSYETKMKISIAKQGSTPWNKGIVGSTPGNRHPCNEETKKKISKKLTGRTRSPESIEMGRISNIGRIQTDLTKEKISNALVGRRLSEEHISKISGRIVSKETRNKISISRKLQVFTKDTKLKLSGKVVVVDINGNCSKIDKDIFYSEQNIISKEFVFHNSKEGKIRKAGPVFSDEEAIDISKMRR